MTDKSRQQRANVKARKAKAKAVEAKTHRSWIDRVRPQPRRAAPNPFSAMMVASMMGTHRTASARESDERFLCLLFGEEYRP